MKVMLVITFIPFHFKTKKRKILYMKQFVENTTF